MSVKEAISITREMGQETCKQLIVDIPEDEDVSYRNGEFQDLCWNPCSYTKKKARNFKLLIPPQRDASNKQLQRIYGTAFMKRNSKIPLNKEAKETIGLGR